jgi:hypothetical protein
MACIYIHKPTGKKFKTKETLQSFLNNNQETNLREEIITSLLAENSFVIEINTAKERKSEFGNDPNSQQNEEYFRLSDLFVSQGLTRLEADKKAREEVENNYFPNSKYYSNLTVPGGTNYTENEIATPDITPNIKGHAQFSTDQGIGWFRSDDKTKEGTGRIDEWDDDKNQRTVQNFVGGEPTKTRRILEVQSDLFQKGRDEKDLLGLTEREKEYYNDTFDYEDQDEAQKIRDELDKKHNNINVNKNQFLQLLNKKNNWVTFFVKSIIQDSAKKGYEKVLFPKGDTAAKIEGHETLEEFKKQKEDRIKELKEELQELEPEFHSDIIQSNHLEIERLEDELADVESGQTQLSSIANFYENTITNILKKNGFNPVEITDEYGNKWNEIEIDDKIRETSISLSPIGQGQKDNIYNELGNKTQEGNVVIKSVYQAKGVEYAKSIGGVFSLRINNTNNHFGNPFSNVPSQIAKGLIPTKSTRESVEKYIDWVLSENTTIKPEQHRWIREQLKSGKLKGKPIVYYKELGEPSHATALDYLINKYDIKESKSGLNTSTALEKSPEQKYEDWLYGKLESPNNSMEKRRKWILDQVFNPGSELNRSIMMGKALAGNMEQNKVLMKFITDNSPLFTNSPKLDISNSPRAMITKEQLESLKFDCNG